MPEKKITFLQACWQGDLAEVTRLLDNGARINQIGRDEYAGVHIAILERNMPLLRLLIERGATAFSLDEKSNGVAENAVAMAAREGFIEAFHYLVDEKGFSMRLAPKEDPALILFEAVSNYKADNILMLKHLVEFKKLDPKRAALPDGFNLLHASELGGGDLTGITEYLLEAGIDPKVEFIESDDEEDGETIEDEYREENPPDFELDDTITDVLDQALEMDQAKEQEQQQEESKPPPRNYSDDDEDEDGEDDDADDDIEFMEAAEGLPLSMATGNGKVERVVLYLRHGADAEQENEYGLTAADAISEKDPGYIYMQEQYAQISAILDLAAEGTKPKDTRSKLLRACQIGDLAKVGKLLEAHQGDPDYINQTNEWGISAIHIAMKTRNIDLLRLLVESGADPYQAPSHSHRFSDLPVEIAAENGFLEGIKYLVDEKSFDLWPMKDRPAEDLLFSAGTIQVLRYLVEEKGLKPALAIRANGEDLLRHCETMDKSPAFIEYILDHGIDLGVEHEYSLEKQDGEPPDDKTDMFGNQLPSTTLRAKYDGLPLVRAAFNANAVLVDIYLRHDADAMSYNSKGNTALDAISDRTNPMYEFNEISYRQISRMLQKSMEGTYGIPPPPEEPETPPSSGAPAPGPG